MAFVPFSSTPVKGEVRPRGHIESSAALEVSLELGGDQR
jgi:hypothetical protein